nr:EAL domain-containing protein [Zoogloea sp.]
AALRWRERTPDTRNQPSPIQIAVNASPRQFVKGRSLESLLDNMDSLGLPGSCIALEITEGLLLDEHPGVTAQLSRLSAAGIQISIDDFGTGYSAMAYLKRMDIDNLKIDRSFIRDLTTDPSDLAITEAIIAMAHKLDLQVVAEGVETEAQRERLTAAGCDFAQGYLFSPALPEAAFFDFIARWHA